MAKKIEGKVAVITGGTEGIDGGRAQIQSTGKTLRGGALIWTVESFR